MRVSAHLGRSEAGPAAGVRLSFRLGTQALAWSTFLPWGLGEGRGLSACGAVGLWPEHRPPSRGGSAWKEQVRPRPFVAWSRGGEGTGELAW